MTVQELISFAKANPGEISISTGTIGASISIAAMVFMTGTDIKLNVIPQAGTSALTVAQVAGGQADLTVNAFPSAKPQLDAGNLRFLAVLGHKANRLV